MKISQKLGKKLESLSLLFKIPGAFKAWLNGYPLDLYELCFTLNKMDFNLKSFIDIGAYHGSFSKTIKLFFPNAVIHAFEPQKPSYQKLKTLSKNYKNFHTYNFALGKERKKENIFISNFEPSSSLLKMESEHIKAFPNTGENIQQQINVRRLDDILDQKDLMSPVLMKIDVQGYEKFVLQGSSKVLKNIDYIICELSIVELYSNQPLFSEMHDFILGLGYSYFGPIATLKHPETFKLLQIDGLFVKN